MWNLQSFIVLVVIFVLLGLAVLFIANNGGFHTGCSGNCASCRQRCSTPKPPQTPAEDEHDADPDETQG